MNIFINYKKISWDKYFLMVVGLLYVLLFLFNSELFQESIMFSREMLIKILPSFVFVFFLMFVINLFVNRKLVLKYLGKKGWVKWLFAIVGGVVSTGPIYAWYPLLKELRDKGMSYGLISCFLYNRPLKLPLFPVFIVYFGVKFVVILSLVMIIASIIQGLIMDKLIKNN